MSDVWDFPPDTYWYSCNLSRLRHEVDPMIFSIHDAIPRGCLLHETRSVICFLKFDW